MRPPRILLALLALLCGPLLRAEEPFFKKGDVIAIVGGEDMVALSEYGYLELLLTRALPDFHLRFRNLAWEGDTVFEQRRDLNFPTWEEQLEKIGATVVLCQFGQMESLGKGGRRKAEGGSGEELKAEVAEFIAAYEKLLERFSGGGKRRIAIIAPLQFWRIASIPDWRSQGRSDVMNAYSLATEEMAKKARFHFVEGVNPDETTQRDGVHLARHGHVILAALLETALGPHHDFVDQLFQMQAFLDPTRKWADGAKQRDLTTEKNRLWFDYWRVQNWAFLAGDRTNQPSSRDHLDPAKRWFPEERERFLPLIEAREMEIDALAAKLAQP